LQVSPGNKNGYEAARMSKFENAPPRRSIFKPLIWFIAGAVTLLLYQGYGRKHALPRVGDSLSTVTGKFETQPRSSLRVASFNIRGGRGMDDDVDLLRTANLLGSFDLIGLNEVRGNLFGSPRTQAEEMGKFLAVPWMFAPSERRFWHDSFGNGLLSRLKVDHYHTVLLPNTQRKGFRNATLAKVPLDGATLNVLVTHLDRTDDRVMQFRAAVELFLSLDEPAVMMGDLNTCGDDVLMQNLLQTAGVHDAIGDTATLPAKERIDWILTRGLQTLESGAVSSAVSDHPLVWAHLALPPAAVERPTPVTNQPSTRPN
jgi:endonuclease/exonuclease/phosphatase family metal-dependent hydrolase